MKSEAPQYTSAEARTALEDLADADYNKLMLIAISWVRKRISQNAWTPEDLLQEAFRKTLDGTRGWSKAVSIIKHLDEVMRSESSHLAKQASYFAPLDHASAETSDDSDARLEVCDELDRRLALFKEDHRALDLLRLKGEGFSPSEVQRRLGITKTEYQSTTKRIRRRLTRHLLQ